VIHLSVAVIILKGHGQVTKEGTEVEGYKGLPGG